MGMPITGCFIRVPLFHRGRMSENALIFSIPLQGGVADGNCITFPFKKGNVIQFPPDGEVALRRTTPYPLLRGE
jgi:hypothetical protein